jgi:hypothetical protein
MKLCRMAIQTPGKLVRSYDATNAKESDTKQLTAIESKQDVYDMPLCKR